MIGRGSYYGIYKLKKDDHIGSLQDAILKNQIRYYGIKAVDKQKLINILGEYRKKRKQLVFESDNKYENRYKLSPKSEALRQLNLLVNRSSGTQHNYMDACEYSKKLSESNLKKYVNLYNKYQGIDEKSKTFKELINIIKKYKLTKYDIFNINKLKVINFSKTLDDKNKFNTLMKTFYNIYLEYQI